MTNALTNQLNGDAAVDLDLSELHFTVFIFVRKKCKKRFLAKPGSEPVTTRVSTGGCLNHSATELV